MGQCSLSSHRKRRTSSPLSSSSSSSVEESSGRIFIAEAMASTSYFIRDVQRKGECETFVIDFGQSSSEQSTTRRRRTKPSTGSALKPLPRKKRNSFRKISGFVKRKGSASSLRDLAVINGGNSSSSSVVVPKGRKKSSNPSKDEKLPEVQKRLQHVAPQGGRKTSLRCKNGRFQSRLGKTILSKKRSSPLTKASIPIIPKGKRENDSTLYNDRSTDLSNARIIKQ